MVARRVAHFYGEWTDSGSLTVQTHIMAVDGTGDRTLPIPFAAAWQAPYCWSNDGTRLLAIRGYSGGVDQARPVVIPVDGSGTGIEIQYLGGMENMSPFDWEWAPDDSSILGTPADPSGVVLDQVSVGSRARHVPDAALGEHEPTDLATPRALSRPNRRATRASQRRV